MAGKGKPFTPKDPRQNAGGAAPVGRLTHEFMANIRYQYGRRGLAEYMIAVAAGDKIEESCIDVGGKLKKWKHAAATRDRIKCCEVLKEWGFGGTPVDLNANLNTGDCILKIVLTNGTTTPARTTEPTPDSPKTE